MEKDPSSPSKQWSIFSQTGPTDQFAASPPRKSAASTPNRLNTRGDGDGDGSTIGSSNQDDVVSELTSLLYTSPPRSTHANNRGMAAAANKAALHLGSPRRPLLAHTPLGSSIRSIGSGSSKTKLPPPLLLQSMRHWEVALPPIKEHVVEGKLVKTFRGSLYGNDRDRSLPVAKRKLTIELFGHDNHDSSHLWGGGGNQRRRRNFADLEKLHRSNYHSGRSSCGSSSCGSNGDYSWELFKGASNDDISELSIAKDDFQSDLSSRSLASNSDDKNRYELAEHDVVVIRVLKSRTVTPYDDDDFGGLRDNTISGGLKERRWECQSLSDKTMSWMVGSEEHGETNGDTTSFSPGDSLTKNHIRWSELSRTRLSQMELVREDFEANEVDLQMGVGARMVVQTIRFDDWNGYNFGTSNTQTYNSHGNARTFARLFRLLKRLQKERAQRLTAANRVLLTEQDSSFGDTGCNRVDRHGNNPGGTCYSEGRGGSKNDRVSILVDIVSASNLPPPSERTIHDHCGIDPYYTGEDPREKDFLDPEVPPSSNPYVVIRDGENDIHTTGFLTDTVEPVWTISKGSLCLLQSNLEDFFGSSNMMEFTIKSHQGREGAEDPIIGSVVVHKTELLKGTEERKRYQILRPPTPSRRKKRARNTATDNGAESSNLYLRYRKASAGDVEFLERLQDETNGDPNQPLEDGAYAGEAFLPPRLHIPPVLTEKSRGRDGISAQYRVKPAPDPENRRKTEWMTEKQIQEAYKEHSASWIEAGSGCIGKLYIEILGCDGLTNLALAKTNDPFVNIVFEDSILNTDVIHECHSPRWMPWSQRAFVLNMMRLSSQIYIGVFHHGRNGGEQGNYDPLGRVAINLSGLRSRAIHTLTYHLYDSDETYQQIRGTITLRLRIAINDGKGALLSELDFREPFYVSTVNESDFRSAFYTLQSTDQPRSLSLPRMTDYANELLGYAEVADHMTDALAVVLLWRGHFPVTLNLDSIPLFFVYNPNGRRSEATLNLPLHSMVAFAWVTILAWDLRKCFSFFLFAIGWAFLAELEYQRMHPSPWRRPKSYVEFLRTLLNQKINMGVLGRPSLRRNIHPDEHVEEIESFESEKAERAAIRQKRLERSSAKREQYQRRLEEEDSTTPLSFVDEQSASLKSNRTVVEVTAPDTNEIASPDSIPAPIEGILFSIQKILWKACRLMRVCRSVFTWKDSYLAFWITSLCFFASFVAFWFPWAMLIQWGFRLFVWPFFGPWMKVVDMHYFQKTKNDLNGEEIVSQLESETLVKLCNRITGREEWSAIRRENALKAKDMKRYMFGKYSIKIPTFREERFFSEPAISSFSVPYNTHPRPVHISRRIGGQCLKGKTVPYQNCD